MGVFPCLKFLFCGMLNSPPPGVCLDRELRVIFVGVSVALLGSIVGVPLLGWRARRPVGSDV